MHIYLAKVWGIIRGLNLLKIKLFFSKDVQKESGVKGAEDVLKEIFVLIHHEPVQI